MVAELILLWDIPGMMLIVEHPSGVLYQNQVGGVVCAKETLEGVLSPLDIDEAAASTIETLPYLQGDRASRAISRTPSTRCSLSRPEAGS